MIVREIVFDNKFLMMMMFPFATGVADTGGKP
jgi:hypothetical protein